MLDPHWGVNLDPTRDLGVISWTPPDVTGYLAWSLVPKFV